jgi:hypothetical protein
MDEEEIVEQTNNSRPWLYKKGQSGNPSGRPKGSISMKTWVMNKLATMTDEEREEFLEGVPKEIIWKMGEGNPVSASEISGKGGGAIEIDVKTKETSKKLIDSFLGE